mmetsp:Transcript_22875/g.26542  ORF Transcript_22875/g.26542 Transcript_22875/m.26542 type:complete len:85 (-) Transcript_22875:29-283(-)
MERDSQELHHAHGQVTKINNHATKNNFQTIKKKFSHSVCTPIKHQQHTPTPPSHRNQHFFLSTNRWICTPTQQDVKCAPTNKDH